jgi:hypothetical protein
MATAEQEYLKAKIARDYAPPQTGFGKAARALVPSASVCFIAMLYGADFGTILLLGILTTLYFLPAMVASAREHHNLMAIVVLNLLAGWTFIGWVGALVWACTTVKAPMAA